MGLENIYKVQKLINRRRNFVVNATRIGETSLNNESVIKKFLLITKILLNENNLMFQLTMNTEKENLKLNRIDKSIGDFRVMINEMKVM
jgi:hypothetical protein